MKKTILSVIFSNFAGAGVAFLFGIILARILSVEDYGRINLIYSLVIILFSFVEFGISNAVVIYYNKEKSKGNSSDISIVSNLNFLFLQYLIVTIPIVVLLILVLNYIYELSALEMVVLSFNYILFFAFRYVLSLHQATGNWRSYNLLNIFNNILKASSMLITIGVFYNLGYLNNYNSALYGYLLFPFILIAVALVKSKLFLRLQRGSKTILTDIARIAVPLGISNFFILLASRGDILIIEHKLGSSQLGIYAAANTLALAFPLITSALRNVFLKEMSNSNVVMLKNVLKKQVKLAPVILITYLFVISISDYLYIYLFGADYAKSANIFNILLLAYVGGMFFTPLESYLYCNNTKSVVYLKFFQMLIVVIFAWNLIDAYGLIGAASSVVLSRLFGWLYVLHHTVKVIKVDNVKSSC